MGNILLRKNDPPGALHEYQEYLGLDPSGPMAQGTREIVAKIQKALEKKQLIESSPVGLSGKQRELVRGLHPA